MKKASLLILKIIMYIEAVVWLVFAMCNSIVFPLGSYMQAFIIVLILMYLNAGAFAVLAFLLKYRTLPVKLLVLSFLLANVVLTFTGQYGIFDDFALVLNLGALVCFFMSASPLRKRNSAE